MPKSLIPYCRPDRQRAVLEHCEPETEAGDLTAHWLVNSAETQGGGFFLSGCFMIQIPLLSVVT